MSLRLIRLFGMSGPTVFIPSLVTRKQSATRSLCFIQNTADAGFAVICGLVRVCSLFPVPMIGKNFRAFSTDWEKFRVNNEPCPFCFWPQRPQRAQRGREGTRSGRVTGEGHLQECLECRCASSDGWEAGGMSTLKTKKTASRTGRRLESGWGETTGTIRDTFRKGIGRPTPPDSRFRKTLGNKRDKGENKTERAGRPRSDRGKPLRGRVRRP